MWLWFIARAEATWTVAAVDPETGEVGAAGATCGPMVWFVAELVPGEGVAISQYDTSVPRRKDIASALAEGERPEEAILGVADPSLDNNLALRQYGAVSFSGPAYGFTGDEVEAERGWYGTEVLSAQGNTLRQASLPKAAADAFEEASDRPLDERLLLALEAGRDLGGDSRCDEDQTAKSAFLMVAAEGDDPKRPTVEIKTSSFLNGDDPVARLREQWQGGEGCSTAGRPGGSLLLLFAAALSVRRAKRL